ncbi:MAG: FHA domain-containing protein [Dehalococcoidia bacterium]
MSESLELLALRLALLGVLFAFLVGTALTLRGNAQGRPQRARGEARAALARLVVVVPARSGLVPGTEFLVAGEMTIGRSGENGIQIGDSSVSGRHASLARSRGRWVIADLGSTNGTAVNGRRISTKEVVVRPGDEISVGAVVLRLTL